VSDAARIVIAGGGSGGHVFPGLAIAEALALGAEVEVVFAGTARGLEASVVPARGYRLELLEVVPIKGGGPVRAVRGVLVAARAVVRSVALVRRLAPRAVVSVGGYAAGPITLAAGLLGVPVAIVEPNGVAGLANRILGPIAKRAYVAWGPAATTFAPRKTRCLGVPIRRGFRPVAYAPKDPPRILVLGGSQGAAPLNERVPEALGIVVRGRPDVQVLHQTGKGRDLAVREAYGRAGVAKARVVPFLDDVASEMAEADVIVARSGAGTVAEIAAVGRPALLVPFPFAADDHQAQNAQAIARAGGAICVRQESADALRIAGELASLLGDTDRRVRMSEASRAFGKPDAATDIARDLCELAGIPWRLPLRGPEKSNGAAARRMEAV
jgi:UDP-N-acetylglucosamine--N-acetylmuramyl-(pentapeptide) pyrophosphoryl-undecaprenol N-acetylglucosamine transferase